MRKFATICKFNEKWLLNVDLRDLRLFKTNYEQMSYKHVKNWKILSFDSKAIFRGIFILRLS